MDNIPPDVWAAAHTLITRAEAANSTSSNSASTPHRPPVYKAIGLSLAVASGLFIGTSFVLKKTGLLRANAKYNEEAGEGYGYLKNAYWWTGMTLMIVGEICNFVAYAFVDAILVTPLGALSVVVTTILSAIFLKERLSFVGKAGCFNCIIGSVVIVMNAPQQSAVADIQEMKHFVIAPGFLSYTGVIIVGCAFIAFWVGPRYGKKSMLVYLSICSLIGGLSVVATQGLGSAIVAQASGKAQFNQWFLYVLLVFVATTLITEIIYLNKALNLFNAALVTPTYYVFFTSSTIVTSAILFRGFHGTAVSIATVIMGFLQICTGVVLLQMSKSAKDVPDAAVFKGDLDQVREIAEQEQPESEPKADAIRGAAAIIRRFSVSRQKMEQEEARRLREDYLKDQLEPVNENEVVEWDGLRRRKTLVNSPGANSSVRRKTTHPPLGMSRFPDAGEEEDNDADDHTGSGFFHNLRQRAQSVRHPGLNQSTGEAGQGNLQSPMHPVALTDIKVNPSKVETPILPYGPGSFEEAQEHIYGLPPGFRKAQDIKSSSAEAIPSPRSKPLPAKPGSSSSLQPSHEARRQFSFTNIFNRHSRLPYDPERPPPSRSGIGSRTSSHEQRNAIKNATEEERLGLVKGDSRIIIPEHQEPHSPEHTRQPLMASDSPHRSQSQSSSTGSVDDKYHYQDSTLPNPKTRRSSFSDSDEDNSWQMTEPPRPFGELRTITPNPTPLHQTLPTTKYRRPSPPISYQQTPSTSVATAASSAQPEVIERKQPPVLASRTMASGGHTPAKATPAVTSSGPFPTSSTNLSRFQSVPTGDPLQHQAPERTTPITKRQDSDRFGENLMRFESPEDYDSSRRRFEEQNRREREERRQRTAGGNKQ